MFVRDCLNRPDLGALALALALALASDFWLLASGS